MKKHILTLILILFTFVGFGQISITSLPYNPSVETFNTYNPTSVTILSTLPNGWSALSSVSSVYNSRNNGSINTGGYYSYGITGGSDWSIGGLRSGNGTSTGVGNITYQIRFINNTLSPITELSLSWDYEQWRFSNNSGWNCSGTDSLSTNTILNSKDFLGSSTGTNGVSTTTTISNFTLTGLNILVGGQFGIKWITTDPANADNGISIDNFKITIPYVLGLPIELMSFEGSKKEEYNVLKWQTASEHNNSHFILERSVTGNYTEKDVINVVNGAGNSTQLLDYNFVDTDAPETINYYRLTQVDYDGNFKQYSPISIDNRVTRNIPKYFNMMGQEVNEYEKGLIILRYEDGTVEKVIR